MLADHAVADNPLNTYKVRLRTLTDRNVSAADVSIRTQTGVTLRATGSAKRVPGDEFHPGVGDTLAAGRALIALGEYMTALAVLNMED